MAGEVPAVEGWEGVLVVAGGGAEGAGLEDGHGFGGVGWLVGRGELVVGRMGCWLDLEMGRRTLVAELWV